MKHFVAYHKLKERGPYDTQQTRFPHYSRRAFTFLEKTLGQQVWVIGGEKGYRSTEYTLLAYFSPSTMFLEVEGGFSVEGDGVGFNPPIRVSSLPWFYELIKEQHNFSLGINEIKNLKAIKGLLANALKNKMQSLSQEKDNLFYLPDEVKAIQQPFIEGAVKQITVNAYERDPPATQACIKHHGVVCKACEFNFEKTYGEIGKDYIHVHHLKPLSDIKENYEVDPIKDLIPVCPNCHAMLHKENPPMSIEKLKNLIGLHRSK